MRKGTQAKQRYRVDPETGCWMWLLSDLDGYPMYGFRRAHRWYYEKAFGTIPDGHDIHHICKTTMCVNPRHLEPIDRRAHKVKHLVGDKGRDFDFIRKVRAERAAGASFRTLAKAHDLSYSTVRRWCGFGAEASWTDFVGEAVPVTPKVCERVDCDELAISTHNRPDKRFCSPRCRTVHNSRKRHGYKPRTKKEAA